MEQIPNSLLPQKRGQANTQLPTPQSHRKKNQTIILTMKLTLPTSRGMNQWRRWRSYTNLLRPFRWSYANDVRFLCFTLPHICNTKNNFCATRLHAENILPTTKSTNWTFSRRGICLTFLRLTITTRGNNAWCRTNNDRRRVYR